MDELKDKKVIIIGLGLTGLSCINFFCARGITPLVMDTNISPPGLDRLPTNVECWLGSLNEQWMLEAALIVVSPGLALSHSALVAAAAAGVEIIGDIELFVREAKAPVVAITGSNGKSTVTHLVSKMANYAGWQVGVGGNIGLPALQLLETSSQLYVLELSSFQLETTYSLHAAAATLLNISEDHMDRYPFGLQQYRAAKLAIYKQADVCVVNAEDNLTLPLNGTDARCISFGHDVGDYHLGHLNGTDWFIYRDEPLLACYEMKIIGRHNYVNALAALALADAVGIPRVSCLTALRQFSGLPHRFELIYTHNGVRWINDSKATNVGSTKAALNSLQVAGTLHLLLGGNGKYANFSPLAEKVQGDNIRLYCFGKDGPTLATLNSHATELTETIEQAMHLIINRVKAGDVVLLSPACASLDQFKNFEMRGKHFSQLARKMG